jgi:hypothetical protein
LLRLVGISAIVVSTALAVSVGGNKPVDAASTKITICHRTHSTTNPYRRITVSQNAVQNARHGGHTIPNGSSNPAVYDSTFTYVPNNKFWGDVIPGATNGGSNYNGSAQVALNWTTAGEALFFGSACKGMSALEFYDSELAAGVPAADIIADLNDQLANEDAALLAALGGSFTLANVSNWATAISVVTDAATFVTSASATLNGTLTVGTTSTVTSFEWGTDPTLTTNSTVNATPSPITGTTSVAAPLSGLAPGTTYFYRVVGVTNVGTDSEGVLNGNVLSFATTVDPSTTTSTTVEPSTTTSTAVAPTTTTTSTTVAPTTTTTSTTVATSTTVDPSTTTTTTVEPSTTTSTSVGPSTTTTTVPTTTTGGIGGRVWIDSNRNGEFDDEEMTIVGVPLTLRAISEVNLPDAIDPSGMPSDTVVMLTDGDGSFRIDGLAPGPYEVTASILLDGFEYTYDSDGGGDWVIDVIVVAGESASADAAGVAGGSLTVAIASLAGAPFTGATVTCNWAGLDGTFSTVDDRVIESIAGSTGVVIFLGVPAGAYECRATQPTGVASSSLYAAVDGAGATGVRLPVDVSPSPVVLPSTGGGFGGSLLLGGMFALVGLVLLLTTRRPTPS